MADPDIYSALDAVSGPVGDQARTDFANAPLATETPADTSSRLYQADTQRRQWGRAKASDLANRGIPSFTDTTGDTKPIADPTGAALTSADPRNSIAYDSSGNAVSYAQKDPNTGQPVLGDPYASAPRTTDKEGNIYSAPKGLPWRFEGQDPAVVQANQDAQAEKLNQQANSALGPYEGQAKTQASQADRAAKASAKLTAATLQKTGVPLTDDTGEPLFDLHDQGLDAPSLKAHIDQTFNKEYASDAANERPWFGNGQYSPAAQALRQNIDQRKAQANAAVDAHAATLGNAQSANDQLSQIQQTRQQLEAQKLAAVNARRQQAGMAPVSIPGLEHVAPSNSDQGVTGTPNAAGNADTSTQGAIPGIGGAQDQITPEEAQVHQQVAAALPPSAQHAVNIPPPDDNGNAKPESFWGTAGRAFASKIIPSIATAAGGLTAGAAAIESGPGAIAADIAAGAASGYATNKAQRAVMGDAWANQNDAQMEANAKEHPIAAQIGSTVPFLVSLLGGQGWGALAKGITGAGKAAVKEALALGEKATLPWFERSLQYATLGARGGASEGVQQKDATPGSVLDATAKTAITNGALGLFPMAKTLISAAGLGKVVGDAGAMALAGGIYDSAIHGKPFDAEEIAKEAGGNIPAFLIQHALLTFLHGGMAEAGKAKIPGLTPTEGGTSPSEGPSTPSEPGAMPTPVEMKTAMESRLKQLDSNPNDAPEADVAQAEKEASVIRDELLKQDVFSKGETPAGETESPTQETPKAEGALQPETQGKPTAVEFKEPPPAETKEHTDFDKLLNIEKLTPSEATAQGISEADHKTASEQAVSEGKQVPAESILKYGIKPDLPPAIPGVPAPSIPSQPGQTNEPKKPDEPTATTQEQPPGTESPPSTSGEKPSGTGNGGVDEGQRPETPAGEFNEKEIRDEVRGRTRKLRASDESHPDHDLMEVGEAKAIADTSGFSAGRKDDRMIVNYHPGAVAHSASIVAKNWMDRNLPDKDAKKQAKRWVRAAHDEELIHIHQLVTAGKGHEAFYAKMWREQIPQPMREAYDHARNWKGERPESDADKAAEFERMVIQYRKTGTISEALFGSEAAEKRFEELKPFLGRQIPQIEANIARVTAKSAGPSEEASQESTPPETAPKSETPSTQQERGPPEPTSDQQAQLAKAKEEFESEKRYAHQWDKKDPERVQKELKAAGMRYAAKKRQITGNLTAKETQAKESKERSNFVGKKVTVDGRNAVVTGNPFGKVSVKFEDGTKKTVAQDQIGDPMEEKTGPKSLSKREQAAAKLKAKLGGNELAASKPETATIPGVETETKPAISDRETRLAAMEYADALIEDGITDPVDFAREVRKDLGFTKPASYAALWNLAKLSGADIPEQTEADWRGNLIEAVKLKESKKKEPAAVAETESAPEAAIEVASQITAANVGSNPRTAKEIKAELITRLKEAINKAPSEFDLNEKQLAALITAKNPLLERSSLMGDTKKSRDANAKIIKTGVDAASKAGVKQKEIRIPGDGTFTVWNTKQVLEDVLRRVEKLPVGKPTNPFATKSSPANTASAVKSLADQASLQLGGKDAAIEWLRENSEGATPTEKAINLAAIDILKEPEPLHASKPVASDAFYAEMAEDVRGDDSKQKATKPEEEQLTAIVDAYRDEQKQSDFPGIRIADVMERAGYAAPTMQLGKQHLMWMWNNGMIRDFPTLDWSLVDDRTRAWAVHYQADSGTGPGTALAMILPKSIPGIALHASKPDDGKAGSSPLPRENLVREAEESGVTLKIDELKGLTRGDPAVMAAVRAKIKARTGRDALYASKPIPTRPPELGEFEVMTEEGLIRSAERFSLPFWERTTGETERVNNLWNEKQAPPVMVRSVAKAGQGFVEGWLKPNGEFVFDRSGYRPDWTEASFKIRELNAGLPKAMEDYQSMIAMDRALPARNQDALHASKPIAERLDELKDASGWNSLVTATQKVFSPDSVQTDEERKLFRGDPNAIGGARHTSMDLDKVTAEMDRRKKQWEDTLKHARDLVSRLSDPLKLELMKRVDEGTPLKEGPYKAAIDQLAAIDSQRTQELKDWFTAMGRDDWQNYENFLKNIVPHYFKDQALAAKVTEQYIDQRKKMAGSGGFLKHREGFTMREIMDWAETQGIKLEPKHTNVIDAVMDRWTQQERYRGAHTLMEAMAEDGRGHWENTDYIPRGNNVKISNLVGRRHVDGRWQDFYADAPSAQIINNYLSRGLRGMKFVENYFIAANALNALQLGVSFFHAGFVTTEGMVSSFALGLQKLFSGDMSGLKEILKAPFSTGSDIMLGRKIRKEMLHPGSMSPDMTAVVDAMVAGGYRDGVDSFYHDQHIKAFFDALHGHKVFTGVLRAPLALIELIAKPIMEYYVPWMKGAAVYKLAQMHLKQSPGITATELHRRLQEDVRSGNSRFGQLTYDNLHLHKTVKDILMGMTRSLGWNFGSLAELGGGVYEWVKFAKNAAIWGARRIGGAGKGGGGSGGEGGLGDEYQPGGKNFPRITNRMAYVLALPIIIGIFGAVLAAMFGQRPKQLKDYYAIKTGEIDDHGNPVRVQLPSYVRDMVSYSKHPLQTLSNKLHPLLAMLSQMLQNRDFFNVEIRHEGDPVMKQILEEIGYVGKQLAPFSVRNAQKLTGSHASIPIRVAAAVGALQIAPSSAGYTAAQEKANDLMREQIPTKSRTQEAADHSALVSQLTGLQRIGKGSQAISAALAAGKITTKDVEKIQKNASVSQLVATVNHLSLSDAKKVESVANPEERLQLRPVIAKKSEKSGKLIYANF